jgi:hypothetical protein
MLFVQRSVHLRSKALFVRALSRSSIAARARKRVLTQTAGPLDLFKTTKWIPALSESG